MDRKTEQGIEFKISKGKISQIANTKWANAELELMCCHDGVSSSSSDYSLRYVDTSLLSVDIFSLV